MELLEDVKRYFPIKAFRGSQEKIIREILKGKDVVAVLPTGTGKSICYQYPAVKFKGLTIVISPLVALMQDQVAGLRKNGISAAALNRITGEEEYTAILSGLKKGEYHLLYVSPERLKYARFVRFVRELPVDMVVVDEAHCISMWGYDFRSDYLYIRQFIQKLDRRPVLAAFSATATEYIQKDISRVLGMQKLQVINDGYARDNLNLSIRSFRSSAGKYKALYAFLKKHPDESGIIYCASVANVEIVSGQLAGAGYGDQVTSYYADLEKHKKNKNYRDFMNNRRKIMVATNAFGMGIDKADIRFVLHFNLPQNIENYYQEIGRAGRDGEPAQCVLYDYPKDHEIIRSLLKEPGSSRFFDPLVSEAAGGLARQRFEEMLRYASEGKDKNSKELLQWIEEYFKEWEPEGSNVINQREISEKIEQEIRLIPLVYTNMTMISTCIRNGNYTCGAEIKVKTGDLEAVFILDQRLDYFDMMVADAVYTLDFFNEKKITCEKVFRLLSGNPKASMNRHKKREEGEMDEKAIKIWKSLQKLMSTHMEINGKGELFLDAGICPGKQLKIEVKQTMPLYRYAEELGQLRTIRRDLLFIKKENGAPWDNSEENLLLRYFFARRFLIARPETLDSKKEKQHKTISNRIRFVQEREDRKGMWEILEIDFGYEQQPALRKRRWETLLKKTEVILAYYKRQGWITEYTPIPGKTEFGSESITGVEVRYL